MQRTVAEILHIKSFGGNTSLENPNFEYDKEYGCMVSGFPIHNLGINNVLVSRSYDLDIALPVFSFYKYPTDIWFENVTRNYWG